MDSLERTFRHLVRTIQASYPAYLTRSFDVAELYQNILPYRHHRRELGLDTNQDYEMVLTELLTGARGYLVVDDRMRDRLSKELASANPDPTAFREFSTAQVQLARDAVRQLDAPAAGSPAAAPEQAKPVPRPSTPSAPAPRPAAPSVPTTPRPPTSAAPAGLAPGLSVPLSTTKQPTPIAVGAGESCRYCGGALPAGRRLVFCPHCGQNLTVVNCLACGTELEVGWKYCTACGRPVTPPGA
jgi:hypothetical protein